jgi:hypothetical protein
MTRSVIKNNFVTSWNVTEIQYDHNTFLFLDSDNIGGVIGTIPSAFTENIIMALPSARQLFSWSDGDELPPGFTYNCIYGFESYGGYGNHLIMEIDSSNVVADPLLVWDYFEPYLSAFSPCIDRADPDSPLDPDSTRSDIGASWFDQSHWINENTLLSSTPMLEISAYPIPFNSYLKIDYSIPAHKPAVFSLIDINGRRIWQDIVMPNNSGSGNLFLDSRNLPSGNYIFIVTTENQQQSLIVNCLK